MNLYRLHSTLSSPVGPVSMLAKQGKLCCVTCNATCSGRSDRIKHYLRGECVPCRKDSYDRIQGPVVINNLASHPTHKLIQSGCTYVCTVCGFRSSERLYKLKDPCKPHVRTAYGKSNIARAAKGDISKVVSNAGSCGDTTPFPASILQTANQVP